MRTRKIPGAARTIQITEIVCLRCGKSWRPRSVPPLHHGNLPQEPRKLPKRCGKCKSPYWHTPRKSER